MVQRINPVAVSPTASALVSCKKASVGFSHLCWSDEDLLLYRQEVRDHYRREQNAACAYCRNPVSLSSVDNCHIEHIVPKSLHPEFIFEPSNLCVVCADCNTIKRAQETLSDIPDTLAKASRRRYPKSSDGFLIVHPHYDDWDDHIRKFGKFYADRSKKGGFTIYACRLNRFFHALGYGDEYLDFTELDRIMSDFVQASNDHQKAAILNKLREVMMI